jgi:hypothetical protein
MSSFAIDIDNSLKFQGTGNDLKNTHLHLKLLLWGADDGKSNSTRILRSRENLLFRVNHCQLRHCQRHHCPRHNCQRYHCQRHHCQRHNRSTPPLSTSPLSTSPLSTSPLSTSQLTVNVTTVNVTCVWGITSKKTHQSGLKIEFNKMWSTNSELCKLHGAPHSAFKLSFRIVVFQTILTLLRTDLWNIILGVDTQQFRSKFVYLSSYESFNFMLLANIQQEGPSVTRSHMSGIF